LWTNSRTAGRFSIRSESGQFYKQLLIIRLGLTNIKLHHVKPCALQRSRLYNNSINSHRCEESFDPKVVACCLTHYTKMCPGVLCFQNVIRFRGGGVNVISCRPVRKERPYLRRLSQNSKTLNSVMRCTTLIKNFTQIGR
jgi:hypothetical protein